MIAANTQHNATMNEPGSTSDVFFNASPMNRTIADINTIHPQIGTEINAPSLNRIKELTACSYANNTNDPPKTNECRVTRKASGLASVFSNSSMILIGMVISLYTTGEINVPPVGFEPTTHGLRVRCSDQLNYGGIKKTGSFGCTDLHPSGAETRYLLVTPRLGKPIPLGHRYQFYAPGGIRTRSIV